MIEIVFWLFDDPLEYRTYLGSEMRFLTVLVQYDTLLI